MSTREHRLLVETKATTSGAAFAPGGTDFMLRPLRTDLEFILNRKNFIDVEIEPA